MNPDVFQKALLATARVACCAALLSCTSRVEQKKTTESEAPKAPITLPISIAPASTPAPASLAASAPTSAEALSECNTHVKNVFVSKAIPQSAHTKECCQKIAESVGFEVQSSWAERSQCCSLLEWNGSVACTPWGPPCPPAMPA